MKIVETPKIRAKMTAQTVSAQLKSPDPLRSKMDTCIIITSTQSNNVYKGDFIKIEDLSTVTAANGDYADVFETDTRWKFERNKWVDSGEGIIINPKIATKTEVNRIELRVADLEEAIENPILTITKI